MRILHIINYFQPKLGYQEYFLAKEHIKMGHDVAVVTSDRYYPFLDFKESYRATLGDRVCGVGHKIEEGIPVYRLPVLFEIRCRVWLLGLEKLILELAPDLIISHGISPSSFRIARLKIRSKKFKLIVDDHMWSGVMKKGIIMKILYSLRKKMITKMLVPHVDKFVGVSQETCEILEKTNGVPKEKIVYIPLGVDTKIFQFNEGGRRKIRNKFNIKDKDILLLCTGKINRERGSDLIVKAFNYLKTDRNIYLLLLGGGSEDFKKELLNSVKKVKRDKVFFHSFIPIRELLGYYSAADICVWDTASISFYEGMSCGRPIICRDASALKERTVNDNGLLFKAGDFQDLAAKMKCLVENDALRKDMGERGRKLVEEKFSWAKIAQDFVDCAKN